MSLDEDCIPVDPGNVELEQTEDGRWRVVDADQWLLAFDEFENAQKARDVIRKYGFDRHCFVGRPDASMEYWLSTGD